MRVFCCTFKNRLSCWSRIFWPYLSIIASVGLALMLVSCAESKHVSETNKEEYVALQDAADVSISYPSNQNGETYGSIAAIPGGLSGALEDFERLSPDLIAVVTQDGVIGYVKKDDWFSTILVGSEDKDRPRKEDSLVVYDVDGRTVIGEFTMKEED